MSFEDVNACAAIVERADPDRFLAAMAAPPEARRKLFVLFAFNVEVARAPWASQEPLIAEMRLQWWRDAVAEIETKGEARRHEVMTPLAEIIDAEAAQILGNLVEARRWDIYDAPFDDEAAFRWYLDATAGGLTWVAARALGAQCEEVVRDLGFAIGLANWLRAIPDLQARGRVPLVDGRPQAVQALAQEGLAALARARARRQEIATSAAPAMLTGWQAGTVLRQVAKDPERVLDGGLGQSEFQRRLSLLARSATGRW